MAIQFNHEHLLTLTEAAKLLPRRRAGRKPHVSTLYRWASRGLRGVVLETIQIGGTTCTTEEALQRFFDELRITHAPITNQQAVVDRIRGAEQFLKNSKFLRAEG